MDPLASRILQKLHQNHAITRRELCEHLGLSPSQVNRLVSELLEQRWIREEVYQDGTPGRPAASLLINPDVGCVVGVEFDVADSYAVLSDLTGQVLASVKRPVRLTSDRTAILEAISDLVVAVCADTPAEPDSLAALGIGLGGIVDARRGVALGWPDEPDWGDAWVDLNVRSELQRRLGTDLIIVEDIVRAVAMHALHAGPSQGVDHVLYVLIRDGIGSALVIDGQPYRGGTGLAGELGHISVSEDGPWCSCGNRGCLEVLASVPQILRRAKSRLRAAHVDSVLRDALSRDSFGLETLLNAAREGDKVAFEVLDYAGSLIGKAIAIALNLFAPEQVVLGGPLTEDGGIVLQATSRQARLRTLRQVFAQVEILYDDYDELAGARGMVRLALASLFESPSALQGLV